MVIVVIVFVLIVVVAVFVLVRVIAAVCRSYYVLLQLLQLLQLLLLLLLLLVVVVVGSGVVFLSVVLMRGFCQKNVANSVSTLVVAPC